MPRPTRRLGPVPQQPPSRLLRVFYPPLADVSERFELVQVNDNGTVTVVEWLPDEPA